MSSDDALNGEFLIGSEEAGAGAAERVRYIGENIMVDRVGERAAEEKNVFGARDADALVPQESFGDDNCADVAFPESAEDMFHLFSAFPGNIAQGEFAEETVDDALVMEEFLHGEKILSVSNDNNKLFDFVPDLLPEIILKVLYESVSAFGNMLDRHADEELLFDFLFQSSSQRYPGAVAVLLNIKHIP